MLVLWLGGIAGVLGVTWFAPQLKIPIQIVNIVDLSFPFMVGAAYSGYGTGRVRYGMWAEPPCFSLSRSTLR
jgi:membrane protein implicated in regulation of membrane protease activity